MLYFLVYNIRYRGAGEICEKCASSFTFSPLLIKQVMLVTWTCSILHWILSNDYRSILVLLCWKLPLSKLAYTKNYDNLIDNYFVKDRFFRFLLKFSKVKHKWQLILDRWRPNGPPLSTAQFSAWCEYMLSSVTLIVSAYFISEVIQEKHRIGWASSLKTPDWTRAQYRKHLTGWAPGFKRLLRQCPMAKTSN